VASNNKPIDSLYKSVSYQIKINGTLLPNSYEVKSIETFKEVNKISKASFMIFGGDHFNNAFDESEDSLFDVGNAVEIQMGYDQKNTIVFEGIIEKHRISIQEGYTQNKERSALVISCVDKAIALVNNYTTQVYKDKTDQQIIAALGSAIEGLQTNIEPTTIEHPVLPKYNCSDWSFILERAKLNGLLVVNSNNVLTLKNPSLSSYSPQLTISHGEGTLSFDATLDATHQWQGLELTQVDPFTSEQVSKLASNQEGLTSSSDSNTSLNPDTDPIQLNISQEIDANELKVIADALYKYSFLNRISGQAKFKGVLDIDLDQVIQLEGFGKRFNGEVYLTAVKHEISEGRIYTAIEFGLKRDLLSSSLNLDLNKLNPPISGLHIGEVIQIDNDPENQYRIKVIVPALNETSEGIWARMTHFYTGSESGAFFLPEIGTKVVLAFVSNDPRFPIIMGSIYSSQQVPEDSPEAENHLKSFVSKSKLKLAFNEEDKSIEISTPNGNSIMLDESGQEISILDENNNSIKLSASGIELQSGGDIKINCGGSMDLSATGQIQLNANTDLNLNALNISQNADANLTAKATANLELNSSGISTLKGSIVQIN